MKIFSRISLTDHKVSLVLRSLQNKQTAKKTLDSKEKTRNNNGMDLFLLVKTNNDWRAASFVLPSVLCK